MNEAKQVNNPKMGESDKFQIPKYYMSYEDNERPGSKHLAAKIRTTMHYTKLLNKYDHIDTCLIIRVNQNGRYGAGNRGMVSFLFYFNLALIWFIDSDI